MKNQPINFGGKMKICTSAQSRRRRGWPHSLRTFNVAVATAAVAFLALWTSVIAQTSQGISGLVTDSTGAAIAKARVAVHNVATGVDKQVVTTVTGNYSVPFLDPGIYEVSAEANNFKTVEKTNITLLTDQTVTVNFQLSPGAVSQTVTVNAVADVLDYGNADRGDVVEEARITQLPVLAGDPFNLAGLSAGVVNTLAVSNYNPYNQTAQSLSIHGNGIELNLDGMSNLSMTGAQNYEYDPPNDAVQEFKIETNAYDAAVGRSPGGAIDMTLKTGGQKLHGDVYEIMRRGFLDANSSINDADVVVNGPKAIYNVPQHTQDYYGFELDGPVILPRIWGRDKKTFFLLSYEEISNLSGGAVTESLPTQAMIGKGSQYPGQGDFSGVLAGNETSGTTYNEPIYDPLSEAACTANNTDPSGGSYTTSNAKTCRYQFGFGPGSTPGPQGNPVQIGPANVIPANRMNPTAMAVLSWYALPNESANSSAASSNPLNGNYGQNNPTTALERNYLLKLDQNIGDNDIVSLELRLFTEFGTSINGSPRENVNASHPGLNWAGYGAHFDSHYKDPSLLVGWTHTFSPNLINSVKASALITDQTDNTGPASGFNPSNLGFSANLAAGDPAYFDRFPSITPGNYYVLGSIPGLERGDNELAINDIMHYNHGNHAFHFGGYIRPGQYSQRISNSSGNGINLSVGKGWTQQYDTVVTGGTTGFSSVSDSSPTSGSGGTKSYSGNSIASMLLSTWDSGNATTQPENYYSQYYYAAFFEDDWRVHPNLTVNLGVRWEDFGGGETDRKNRQIYDFDSTDINPINSLANTSGLPITGALLGGITFAGVNGNPRHPFQVVYYDFGPRAGFAYTLNQKTVVRGGIGVYYQDDANGGAGNNFAPAQTGYSSTTTYTGSNDGGATPLQNLSNPFPNLQTPTGDCGGNQFECLETNAGQTLSFINPHYHPPVYIQESFGFERQLTSRDTLEVAYTGTRGYGLSYTDDLNHVNAAAQAACDPERGGPESNCTSGASTGTGGYVANPFKGLAPFAASGTYYTASTIQKINFTRPFPIFYNSNLAGNATSVAETSINGGHYWYNGLEATFDHRTSYGLTLHGTYTYSKAIQAVGYADYVNRISARTVSGTDLPHRITISGIYLLPFGQGRGIFPNMSRIVDFALGGWQVASIFTYQSGLPFTIGGYEINKTANGGYILPRKRFWPGNSNPYWPGSQGAGKNSYVQAFKPCVGTRNTTTGAITLESYSVAAGCQQANFVQILSNYSVIPNVEYTGVRYQRIVDDDANISKNFKIWERMTFQLRMDAFNVMNHVIQNSSGYDTTVGDSNFGTYQMGTSGGGNYTNRQIQLSGHLTW
jgi:Carboxypeptidase regulatory-like domain